MNRLRSLVLGYVALGCVATAFAHDPGLSSAHVARTSAGLTVTLTFDRKDLSTFIEDDDVLEAPADKYLPVLGAALAKPSNISVQVFRAGMLVPPVESTPRLSAPRQNEVVVSMEWLRVPPESLRIEIPLLAHLAFGHRMMVTLGESPEAVALLDARHAAWELPATSLAAVAIPAGTAQSAAVAENWTSFVLLGVEHILTGFDHLCFLFALLLVAIRLRDVLAVVTTFTVAHSVTLAAAATGMVSLSPRIVEPLIAASIVYIAIENLFLRQTPRHRLALVFGFGLVHGLGFASALKERLPGVTGFSIVPPLLGFNLGVELGQLAVAVCLVPLIGLARRQPAFAPRLQPSASLIIAAAGVIWFWQRV